MIPGDLLDPKYSEQQPIVPVPTTTETYEAYAGEAVASMPTVRVVNAVSRMNSEQETPMSPDFLNKAFPPVNTQPFDTQMSYSDAKDLYQERTAQADRQSVIQRSDMSGWGDFAFKSAVNVGTMLGDPITDVAFLATDGLAAAATGPLAKAVGYVAGEGIIAKAAVTSLKFGIHGGTAGLPLTGLNAALAKSEGTKYSMEDALSEEENFALGGLGLGLIGGGGLGVLQKVGMFSKVGEELFSKLKPNEKEAIMQNTASQLQGKGQSDFVMAGLTDTVANNEAKLGISARDGATQAAIVNEMEPHDPAELFTKQGELDFGDQQASGTPEAPAGAEKQAFVDKAYAVKDLNSHETKQLYFSTGDEHFLTLSEQKWKGEQRALAVHFLGMHPEDIAAEAEGNPVTERFVRENYPDLTDAFVDKTSEQGAEGDQAVINQNRRDIIQKLEESDNPLTKKLFYSDDGEQLPLNFSPKEVEDFGNAARQDPEKLYKGLIEQRKAQVQQMQTDRLNSIKDQIKNGTFDKSIEPDPVIPKDFAPEPYTEVADHVDEQTRQVDDLQKSLEEARQERVNMEDSPEAKEAAQEKMKAETEEFDEEIKRKTAQRGYLRKATDCFFGALYGG